MDLKENIKNRRLELNLTLEEVLKVTPSWLLGWETNLSKEEKALIDKYKQLDELGKYTVNVVLRMEFDRCKNNY